MFDTDEETFLERIPYPEALSRSALHVGEMWKLQANVEYVQSFSEQVEHEHTEAVQAAHDDHDDDKSNGEAEGQRERTTEIKTALAKILENNVRKDWESEIALYFEELEGFDQVST